MSSNYNHRYIARICIETETPLKVGTGRAGLLTDEMVATDAFGFPFIPGTALTGVLRNSLSNRKWLEDIFGHNEKRKYEDGKEYSGEGSRLIVSSASMVGEDGKVIEAPVKYTPNNSFYPRFEKLPARDHVKITHLGASDDSSMSKFDKQVVYRGTRFVFELELIGNEENKGNWDTLLNTLASHTFRLGGGTRRGFGKLKIISELSTQKVFNLTETADLKSYLSRGASLNSILEREELKTLEMTSPFTHYQLQLTPEDYFIFGSGHPKGDIDSVAKTEPIISWENGKAKFTEDQILIPASSVKGAIAHRVAFHYNRLQKVYADELNDKEKSFNDVTGQNNEAVKTLFGHPTNEKDNEEHRGRVILSDLYLEKTAEKLLNHVAIDRFTGGAMDGALFNEKVVQAMPLKLNGTTEALSQDTPTDYIELNLYVEPFLHEEEEKIVKALECTLQDICTGMLPLGASVMRGHGCFKGNWKIIETKQEVDKNE
ncbi:MAG: RAMP superfamily CRISPR-associated protein [Marinifilaceae bacterium]